MVLVVLLLAVVVAGGFSASKKGWPHGVCVRIYSVRDSNSFLRRFPRRIVGWEGEIVPMDQRCFCVCAVAQGGTAVCAADSPGVQCQGGDFFRPCALTRAPVQAFSALNVRKS